MSISLGNLSVSALESRLGIKFTEEDFEFLSSRRRDNATLKEVGTLHIFDLPLSIQLETTIKDETIAMLKKYYDSGETSVRLTIAEVEVKGE